MGAHGARPRLHDFRHTAASLWFGTLGAHHLREDLKVESCVKRLGLALREDVDVGEVARFASTKEGEKLSAS